MSSHLGVKKALELLDSLKSTARDCTATEEKLSYEFRLKVSRERQSRDELIQQDAAKLAEDLAAVDAQYEFTRLAVETTYGKRKALISRSRTSAKEQFLARIEGRTGSLKYQLQKQLIEAERTRDSNLATAAEAYDQYSNRLAMENARLDALLKKARAALRGHHPLNGLMARFESEVKEDLKLNREKLSERMEIVMARAETEVRAYRNQVLALLFRLLPVWLLLPLCAAPLVLQYFGILHITPHQASGIGLLSLTTVTVLYALGFYRTKEPAHKLAVTLASARKLYEACLEKSAEQNQMEIQTIHHIFTETTTRIDENLRQVLKDAATQRGNVREIVDDKTVRVASKNEKRFRTRIKELEDSHNQKVDTLKRASELRQKAFNKNCADREEQLNADMAGRWNDLETLWRGTFTSVYETFQAAEKKAEQCFPPWSRELLQNWKPPGQFLQMAQFGEMKIDLAALCETLPKDPRLALPIPAQISAPAQLAFPDQSSILFETGTTGRDEAVASLNNLILRLLLNAPPGRLSFTVIDPVGLGQNFAGVMHLADYGERLINSRIWTQANQIEERLAELNDHMEKVIQMYLRNEYETITEYNAAAGNIAERYHFLVVADFPANFSEVAIKRLQSIANSGARCGVYSLIHWDTRIGTAEGLVPDVLRKTSVCLSGRAGKFSFTGRPMNGISLSLNPAPDDQLATEITHKIGEASRDSSRVEVPFSHVTPPDEKSMWSLETTRELQVPIGRTGATKLQYLAIGKGTRQHVLIAGKTGSGKSTLFHVMITNLALWCSPEQVEFYLVDFKKGVEFKCYATHKLPHAKVVAIESDREFGLSVLERVDEELKRRGELFRKLGVQDVAGYKREGGSEPMPRSLLMIDEFQELFTEDDKISQSASVLLDRIVRQGRAFGIHVILGSQTLGGAYTVARTTLGQMVIRIALQCNEADAYLIMDDTNPAPRMLTRPGEGIYNDSAGSIEGNSPFQAVWLSDEIRDEYLDKVTEQQAKSGKQYPTPIIYEGDAPADIRENTLLNGLLKTPATQSPLVARTWLGAPNSIKGPTQVDFHRQSGNHLLIIGQRDEAALGMIAIALVALSAQYPAGGARFYVLDSTQPSSQHRDYLERVGKSLSHPVTQIKGANLAETFTELSAELERRTQNEHGSGEPSIFLFINGIQRFSKLRHEETFSFSADDSEVNPGQQLNKLICEGASVGIHVIVSCDTYNNVNRFFAKKAFSEFEMRVLFQMSETDSASICDSPKAGSLGLHRALFYNEQEGYLETFRPYALPDEAWVQSGGK